MARPGIRSGEVLVLLIIKWKEVRMWIGKTCFSCHSHEINLQVVCHCTVFSICGWTVGKRTRLVYVSCICPSVRRRPCLVLKSVMHSRTLKSYCKRKIFTLSRAFTPFLACIYAVKVVSTQRTLLVKWMQLFHFLISL